MLGLSPEWGGSCNHIIMYALMPLHPLAPYGNSLRELILRLSVYKPSNGAVILVFPGMHGSHKTNSINSTHGPAAVCFSLNCYTSKCHLHDIVGASLRKNWEYAGHYFLFDHMQLCQL